MAEGDYTRLNPYGEEEEVSYKKNWNQSARGTIADPRDAFPKVVYDWLGETGVKDADWRDPRYRQRYMQNLQNGVARFMQEYIQNLFRGGE